MADKELEDLASMFGNDGDKASRRAEHGRVVTRAAAAAERVQQEVAMRSTTPGSQAKPADLMGDFAATERDGPNTRSRRGGGGGGSGGVKGPASPLKLNLEAAAEKDGFDGEEAEKIAAAIRADLAADSEQKLQFSAGAAQGGVPDHGRRYAKEGGAQARERSPPRHGEGQAREASISRGSS